MRIKRLLCLLSLTVTAFTAGATSFHVAKTGNDQNPGDKSRPFLTINHAARIAKPGDIIIVHTGIYREWVQPEHERVIYETAKNEKVIISGAEIVSGWKKVSDQVWRLALPNNFFGGYNPFDDLISGDWYFGNFQMAAPLNLPNLHGHRLHTGEVYLNGKALHEGSIIEVLNGENTGNPFGNPQGVLNGSYTWHAELVKDSTHIIANFQNQDPNNALTEVNVRPTCFYPIKPGINYITVRGFHIRQSATQWAAPTAEQIGAIGTHWSKGWLIENNVISESKCAGITLGKDRKTGHNEWSKNMAVDGSIIYNKVINQAIAAGWNKANIGSHIIRNNEVYNCGASGICGSLGAIFSTIVRNNIHDIYTNRRFWGAEMGGIKIHGAIDVKITKNRIRNTNIGIWLDWMAQGTEISSNYCSDNDYVDLFMEVNHGPYSVKGNHFLSRFSLKDWSENGTFSHNTFAGLLSFAAQERETPVFKAHSTFLVETTAVKGGGNVFLNNRYLNPQGKNFVPLPGAVIPRDGIDSLSGYRQININQTQ